MQDADSDTDSISLKDEKGRIHVDYQIPSGSLDQDMRNLLSFRPDRTNDTYGYMLNEVNCYLTMILCVRGQWDDHIGIMLDTVKGPVRYVKYVEGDKSWQNLRFFVVRRMLRYL